MSKLPRTLHYGSRCFRQILAAATTLVLAAVIAAPRAEAQQPILQKGKAIVTGYYGYPFVRNNRCNGNRENRYISKPNHRGYEYRL